MRKFFKFIKKEAKTFSEIEPILTAWKESLINKYNFIAFDQMATELIKAPELKNTNFANSLKNIRNWQNEHLEKYQVDFKKEGLQISYAFPVGPGLDHIIKAENRLIIACLIVALKTPNDNFLYLEFEHFKKAHEIQWNVSFIDYEAKWTLLIGKTKTEPKKQKEIKSRSALELI